MWLLNDGLAEIAQQILRWHIGTWAHYQKLLIRTTSLVLLPLVNARCLPSCDLDNRQSLL